MSGETYFVRSRGKVTGPFTSDGLEKLARRGLLSRVDEISTDKISWQTAGDIQGAPPSGARAAGNTAPGSRVATSTEPEIPLAQPASGRDSPPVATEPERSPDRSDLEPSRSDTAAAVAVEGAGRRRGRRKRFFTVVGGAVALVGVGILVGYLIVLRLHLLSSAGLGLTSFGGSPYSAVPGWVRKDYAPALANLLSKYPGKGLEGIPSADLATFRRRFDAKIAARAAGLAELPIELDQSAVPYAGDLAMQKADFVLNMPHPISESLLVFGVAFTAPRGIEQTRDTGLLEIEAFGRGGVVLDKTSEIVYTANLRPGERGVLKFGFPIAECAKITKFRLEATAAFRH